jgi:hypothetical protein
MRSPSQRLSVVDPLWEVVETRCEDLGDIEGKYRKLPRRRLRREPFDGYTTLTLIERLGTLSLTNPVACPGYLLEVLEALIKTFSRPELFQLHHDLQPLCVTLDVEKHQLRAKQPYRAHPS